MARIKDIAKLADVSVATVSYVLNNNRYVSPEKKERVLQVIRELNYVPNAVARGLRVKQSRTISLVVADITNPFYPDIAKACEDVAYAEGFSVNIINANEEPEKLEEAVKQLRDGRTDGMIVTTALEKDRPILEQLSVSDFPVVLAHRELRGLPFDSIVSDNEEGVRLAVRHLAGLGHRKIAMMSGVSGSEVNKLRIEGYKKVMHEAGLDVRKEWIEPGEARYGPSYEATKKLMRLADERRPTAIINISDLGALGAIDAAFDLGISVPADLAVIGFDDLFVAQLRLIQLTTVKIPRYEIGRQATALLLDKIKNGNKGAAPVRRVLPVELVVRNTCGGKTQC